MRTASVVVNCYNYGRYLCQAIDSALAQTDPCTEVVVVDDGSSDESPAIISAYGNRITPVLKPNGGQASAFNAGFAASSGDPVIFLDADDLLLPTAVERARARFVDPAVVKVHWPLEVIGSDGARTGKLTPGVQLAEGDLREMVAELGPTQHGNPPTSGNAWSRRFLEQVLPIPEAPCRICADIYLLELAPLYGTIGRIDEPQALYRVHGTNNYASQDFDQRLEHGVRLFDLVCDTMAEHGRRLGFAADAERYRRHSWFHRLRAALDDVAKVVPAAAPFLLADQDEWGLRPGPGCQVIPFPEREGISWGAPADDAAAIDELERQRRCGIAYLVLAWPAFWWLEHYSAFDRHLRERYWPVLENDRLIIFHLEP